MVWPTIAQPPMPPKNPVMMFTALDTSSGFVETGVIGDVIDEFGGHQ